VIPNLDDKTNTNSGTKCPITARFNAFSLEHACAVEICNVDREAVIGRQSFRPLLSPSSHGSVSSNSLNRFSSKKQSIQVCVVCDESLKYSLLQKLVTFSAGPGEFAKVWGSVLPRALPLTHVLQSPLFIVVLPDRDSLHATHICNSTASKRRLSSKIGMIYLPAATSAISSDSKFGAGSILLT
jgi:hypothetical protein